MQDRRNAAVFGPVSYRGLLDTCLTIIKFEGPIGLYKGLLPNLARSLPLNTITLVLYQSVFLPLFQMGRK